MNLHPTRSDQEEGTEDVMNNNSSLYTADRATHLKIVAVALVAGTLIAGFGIAARNLNLGTDILTARGPSVYQAAPSVLFSSRDNSTIR
jgi:hypothetical protein